MNLSDSHNGNLRDCELGKGGEVVEFEDGLGCVDGNQMFYEALAA